MSVFGTTALIVSNATFTTVPGLAVTITVPADADVYVSTDGGVLTNSTTPEQGSIVDVAFSIDGGNPETSSVQAGFRRVNVSNSNVAGLDTWSFGETLTLTPGTHTIAVQARLGTGAAATVSGDGNSALQGQLTVLVVKN